MDEDEAGRMCAPKIAAKLGLNRTFIVRTLDKTGKGPKDANDALKMGLADKMNDYLKKARTIPDTNILTFTDVKDLVERRIQRFELDLGMKSEMEFFNEKIKGLRGGELTILSGATGSGKTTLLSQLSLDFCKQGLSTLWGSFEIKNEILITNMMMQFSKKDLLTHKDSFSYYAEQFEKLPLYFMSFYGSQDVDKIMSCIEYAIYQYDIQHIIIDNLQFLLGTQARGFDKFDLQDKVIERFRNLVSTKNVHLTLVIHPKKVNDNEDLNISSVFGSAKATQEADNVMIMQNREKYRMLEIKKNRFDGTVGRTALIFDRKTKRFV